MFYSIAIDNQYSLYVNGTDVDSPANHYGYAQWAPLKALPGLVANTNSIDVVFWGDCDNDDYFSMIVTTNNCGW